MPVVQRMAVVINLLERASDVVHVVLASEEHALFEPDALFTANEVAVRAMGFAVTCANSGIDLYVNTHFNRPMFNKWDVVRPAPEFDSNSGEEDYLFIADHFGIRGS